MDTLVQNRLVESPKYRVYYIRGGLTYHDEVTANDHLDAIKVVEARYDQIHVNLVFKGESPEPVWML